MFFQSLRGFRHGNTRIFFICREKSKDRNAQLAELLERAGEIEKPSFELLRVGGAQESFGGEATAIVRHAPGFPTVGNPAARGFQSLEIFFAQIAPGDRVVVADGGEDEGFDGGALALELPVGDFLTAGAVADEDETAISLCAAKRDRRIEVVEAIAKALRFGVGFRAAIIKGEHIVAAARAAGHEFLFQRGAIEIAVHAMDEDQQAFGAPRSARPEPIERAFRTASGQGDEGTMNFVLAFHVTERRKSAMFLRILFLSMFAVAAGAAEAPDDFFDTYNRLAIIVDSDDPGPMEMAQGSFLATKFFSVGAAGLPKVQSWFEGAPTRGRASMSGLYLAIHGTPPQLDLIQRQIEANPQKRRWIYELVGTPQNFDLAMANGAMWKPLFRVLPSTAGCRTLASNCMKSRDSLTRRTGLYWGYWFASSNYWNQARDLAERDPDPLARRMANWLISSEKKKAK